MRDQPERVSHQTRTGSRTRRAAFAAVTVVLVLLVALAVLEGGLRLRHGRIERLTGVVPWTTSRWEGLAYHWDLYHPRWGWTNRPGYRSGPDVPFEVTIGERGLRGAQHVPPRPPEGVRRIALFGDSCVFGEEVDDDETLPAFLGRQLDGVEALNFGVHGYGLGQMVLRLEDQGLELAPDHVVIAVLLPTDLVRDPLPVTSHPKPVFAVREGELVVGNVPVPEASRLNWPLRHSFAAAWLWGRPPGWPEPESVGEHLEIGRHLVARAGAACAARGVELTVVLLAVAPTLEQMRHDRGHAEQVRLMRARFASWGIDLLDAVPFLARAWEAEGAALVAPRGHWSARGNCVLSALVADHLARRRGWTLRGQSTCPPGKP